MIHYSFCTFLPYSKNPCVPYKIAFKTTIFHDYEYYGFIFLFYTRWQVRRKPVIVHVIFTQIVIGNNNIRAIKKRTNFWLILFLNSHMNNHKYGYWPISCEFISSVFTCTSFYVQKLINYYNSENRLCSFLHVPLFLLAVAFSFFPQKTLINFSYTFFSISQ